MCTYVQVTHVYTNSRVYVHTIHIYMYMFVYLFQHIYICNYMQVFTNILNNTSILHTGELSMYRAERPHKSYVSLSAFQEAGLIASERPHRTTGLWLVEAAFKGLNDF